MKNLRQFVRRSGLLATGKRRRRLSTSRRSDATNRRLSSETLEKRHLLAGGILASQNVANRYDVNADGSVTARDALGVVNFLARSSSSEGESSGLTSSSAKSGYFYDVNGDNNVTAADALGVINALARAEGELTVLPINLTYSESDGGAIGLVQFSLLDPQFVIGSAGLDLASVEITIASPVDAGSPVSVLADGRARINLKNFAELNEGESATITINYLINELVNGSPTGTPVPNTATITINGVTNVEVEYILTARDLNDAAIAPQNGVVNVGVDQEFYLEVSYEDFRSRSNPDRNLGIFKLLTDITFDNASVITPILFESQRLEILGVGTNAPDINPFDTQSVVFTIPSSPSGTTTYTWDVPGSPDSTFEDEVVAALTAFGYTPSQYRLEALTIDGGATGTKGFGQRVVFDAAEFGNMDLPNISVTVNEFGIADPAFNVFAVGNSSETPALINGQPNSAAVPFSIERRSRTFNNLTGGFGQVFYGTQNSGAYDPAVGFTGVGGLGGIPSQGGGVPQLDLRNQFFEPFDAFSLRVKINQPDATVTATVGASVTQDEFLLLYGYDNERIAGNVIAEQTEGNLGDFAPNGVARIVVSTATPNDNPVVTGEVTATFSENDAPGSVDLLAGASDPNGDALNVANLALDASNMGNPGGITPNGNSLSVDPAFYGFLNDGENEVIVYAYNIVDGRGGSVPQKATITITGVTNPNSPPIIQNQTFSIVENSAGGTSVGTVVATDPEQGPLTFAITAGNTGNAFAINGTTGELTVLTQSALDFETVPSFALSVSVTDNGGLTRSATMTVNLTNVNEAPVLNDRTIAVNETVQPPTVFATIQAIDPEGDSLTYSVIERNDNGLFSLSPTGQLSVAATPLPPDTTYSLTVEVTDGEFTDTAVITINVTDVNQRPTANDATFSVDENSALGTAVGSVVANDPDGDTLTYAITAGNTNGAFAINPATGEITVNGSINFESQSSYLLTVTVSDPDGLSDPAAIRINVNDVNESPTVQDQTFEVPEDAVIGTVVGTIQASDPDAGDQLTFELTGGSGVGVFNVSATGQVTTLAALDFETVPQYTINVRVTDLDGLSDPGVVTIKITNVNEAPIVGNPITATFSEQDGQASVALLTGATDPDGDTNSLTVANFSLVSGSAAGISRNGTQLTVVPGANGDLVDGQSRTNVYRYDVVDSGGASTPQFATITINGFNDPPNARDDSRVSIKNRVVVVDVLDNDDVGDGESGVPTLIESSVVLSASSVGNAVLSVNASTGEVTVTPTQDFIGTISFTYTIEDAQGKQDSATATVTFRDFEVSTISGLVFEDTLENGIDVILNGAAEIRNGIKDIDEVGIAGLTVELFSAAEDNATNEDILLTATTDLEGAYQFGEIPPGMFTLRLVSPRVGDIAFEGADGVLDVSDSATQMVSIGPEGGETITGIDWYVTSIDGQLRTTNLLASGSKNLDKDGNPEGAFALLDESGKQVFVGVPGGFEGVEMVKLTYDHVTDEALLEVLNDGEVYTRTFLDVMENMNETNQPVRLSQDGLKIQLLLGFSDLFGNNSGSGGNGGGNTSSGNS